MFEEAIGNTWEMPGEGSLSYFTGFPFLILSLAVLYYCDLAYANFNLGQIIHHLQTSKLSDIPSS